MSRGEAALEIVVLAAAYLVGLWVIVFGWADAPAGQVPSLLVGLAVAVAVAAVPLGLVARRRPAPRPARTWRYWIPVGVAVAAAAWVSAGLQGPAAPDVATYAVAIPLVILGRVVSNIWLQRDVSGAG
jgi:hypothetical protein